MNKVVQSSVILCRSPRKFIFALHRSNSFSTSSPKSVGSQEDSLVEVDDHYDIIISGGGLVGGTCAVALARSPVLSNLKILLLESSKSFTAAGPLSVGSSGVAPFSNRVYAISPGSKAFLEKINVWQDVWRSQEVVALQVWDAISDAKLTLSNPEYDPVCHIVESPVFSHAVEKALLHDGNVKIAFGSSLDSYEVPVSIGLDQNAVVKLSDGKRISTRLLIGADGYNSKVRKIMKAPYLNGSYDRTAIVATLRLIESTENNMAWQRFLPTGGPIAVLPLSPEYSSLVWSTTVDNAKRLMQLSETEFVDEVNSALWKEFPRSELVEMSLSFFRNILPKETRMLPPSFSEIVAKSRATFPLGYGHSGFYVHKRVALIGDAAHRVHPLGGQGLNLGIGDAAELVNTVGTALRLGDDIGSLERLKHYETARQRHNVVIQSGLDAIHRFYSFQFPPLVVARSLGLTAFDRLGVLKKMAMAQAAT